jgi:hypothetical protein
LSFLRFEFERFDLKNQMRFPKHPVMLPLWGLVFFQPCYMLQFAPNEYKWIHKQDEQVNESEK